MVVLVPVLVYTENHPVRSLYERIKRVEIVVHATASRAVEESGSA